MGLIVAYSSFFILSFRIAEEPYFFSLASFTYLRNYSILIFFLFVVGFFEQLFKLMSQRNAKLGSISKTGKLVRKPALAATVAIGLAVIGLINASQPHAVKSIAITIHKLPLSMNNLKIVLLSDIHLGPTIGKTKLQMIVKIAKTLKPNFTVIVGDLTNSEVKGLAHHMEPLGQIDSPLGFILSQGIMNTVSLV